MGRLRTRRICGLFVAAALCSLPSFAFSQQSGSNPQSGSDQSQSDAAKQQIVLPSVQEVVADFDLVWQSINDEYYDPKFNGVDWAKAKDEYRTKIQNAKDGEEAYKLISELLGKLKDPGTGVLPPWLVPTPESQSSQVQLEYGGVGMLLGQSKSGDVTVLDVFDSTPAKTAGVLVGDVIVSVDDWKVTGSDPLSGVTDRARGPVGSSVRMTLRDPAGDERTVSMTRAKINLNPKVEQHIIQGSIGYLRIPVLSPDLITEASKALPSMLSTQYLILDLRGVSGGSLEAMEQVAGWFLGAAHMGGFVARSGGEELPYHANQIAAYQRPIAVITDSRTYGPAEILADLVKTYKRGKLVGEKTSGGFVIGKDVNLPSGGLLHFTVARYVAPDGQPLPIDGIAPDVAVPAPDLATIRSGKDPYLDKAIEVLRSGIR